MKLAEAEKLAHELMQQHGISSTYRFHFDNAKRRFGKHHGKLRFISISRPLTLANAEDEVRDTILHEIAHALVLLRTGRGHGHDDVWQQMATEIGARPKARVKDEDGTGAVRVPARWTATCVNCGKVYQYYRRCNRNRRRACKACCNKLNGGKFDERCLLLWERQLPDFV